MAFTCPPRSQLTVSSCQQPWPRSLAHCCFRKCIFKPPWLWDQPGNVPARGGSSQKAVWNYAPVPHAKEHRGNPTVISSQLTPSFPHSLQVQSLLLWRDGSSFGAPSCRVVTQYPPVICLGCYSSGAITERWWQNFEQGVFFLISFCRLPEQATLCTASLYWSKTMLYLFI